MNRRSVIKSILSLPFLGFLKPAKAEEETEFFTGCFKIPNKTTWYRNGKLHRDDGPAVESANGTKAWYKYGRRHRSNGPAIIHPDGYKEWWSNGEIHREDGPAIISPYGYQAWFLNGTQIRRQEL